MRQLRIIIILIQALKFTGEIIKYILLILRTSLRGGYLMKSIRLTLRKSDLCWME